MALGAPGRARRQERPGVASGGRGGKEGRLVLLQAAPHGGQAQARLPLRGLQGLAQP